MTPWPASPKLMIGVKPSTSTAKAWCGSPKRSARRPHGIKGNRAERFDQQRGYADVFDRASDAPDRFVGERILQHERFAEAQLPTEQQADPEESPEDDQADPADPGSAPPGEPPGSLPPPPEEEGMSPLVKGILAGVVGLVAIAVVVEITNEEEIGSPF